MDGAAISYASLITNKTHLGKLYCNILSNFWPEIGQILMVSPLHDEVKGRFPAEKS